MSDETEIKPFHMKRLCQPSIDVSQLTLTSDVDRSESIYTQKYVKLANASLPGGVIVHEDAAELFSWDLFLILKYQQKWTPSGYGLGDLIYTISLLPNEELTLELKTWETSKTQQDTEDSTDQRNVSDIKSNNTNSSEVSEAGEATTNTSVNGKAGYSGWGFSASIEASWSENVKQTHAENAKRTREQSQQLTNEYKASHKVKLAVSREVGSESKTTRKIKNINQAHTLNVNYFEVLNRYNVQLSLTAVPMAILGPEADLASDVLIGEEHVRSIPNVMYMLPEGARPKFVAPRFPPDLVLDPGDISPVTPESTDPANPTTHQPTLTLGRLIRYSQSPAWVGAFIDANGFSPIKLLYELWSQQLFLGAVPPSSNMGAMSDIDRTAFRDGVLQFVRPVDGWVASDEKGEIRWGYEVIVGKEADLLAFLYPRLPNSSSEMSRRISHGGVELAVAADIVARRLLETSEPPLLRGAAARLARSARAARPAPRAEMPEIDATRIATEGPFMGKTLAEFHSDLPRFINDVMTQLDGVRTGNEEPVETWEAVLPSQGVYADLTLGICSGAEDYLEIQRQFDLETRKLEIEKLKCEIEKMKLENQATANGTPAMVIETGADQTTLALNFTTDTLPSSVKVQAPGS